MTKREYMDILEKCAGEYYLNALASIKAHRHMNNLDDVDFRIMEISPEASQKLAEAVLADFINFVGEWHGFHGLDEGFYVKHLAEEREKNKKLENNKKKK